MKYFILLLGLVSFEAVACDSPLVSDGVGNCINPADYPGTTVENCLPPFALLGNQCFHQNIVNRRTRNLRAAEEATVVQTPEQVTEVPQVETPVTVAEENPTPPEVVTTPDPVPEATTNPTVSSQESLADTFASYDPASCEWTADLPRKLHTAPGCTRSTTNQICVGYVVCNAREGGGKFVRTATCGVDKCGSSEAVACVNDRAFYSAKPEESVGRYMSDRVKSTVIGQ